MRVPVVYARSHERHIAEPTKVRTHRSIFKVGVVFDEHDRWTPFVNGERLQNVKLVTLDVY